VYVDTYNEGLKDNQGFVGDRANKGAFRQMIDGIRKSVRKRKIRSEMRNAMN
jgi:hypothetical protein